MNNLNQYIIEKFKISKDIKNVSSGNEKISEFICKLCLINTNKVSNIINSWVVDNDVKIIDLYNLEDKEYRNYISKNAYKIGRDVLNKSYDFLENRFAVGFSDFMKQFYKYFTRDSKIQNEATKYDTNDLQILVNEKALCMIGIKFKFIFIKKETI